VSSPTRARTASRRAGHNRAVRYDASGGGARSGRAHEGYQTIFDRRRTATQEVRTCCGPMRISRIAVAPASSTPRAPDRATEVPYGRVLGTPHPRHPRLTDRSTATTFDQISIQPPRGASYHVGGLVLLVRIDRDIPAGRGRGSDRRRTRDRLQPAAVLADVIMQFGRVHDGHSRCRSSRQGPWPGAPDPGGRRTRGRGDRGAVSTCCRSAAIVFIIGAGGRCDSGDV